MNTTVVFKKNLIAWQSGVRRIVNMGGTRSGKTFALLQLLLEIAQSSEVSISVVSESLPHLKLGAIREFENILKARNLYNDKDINHTDHVYSFGKSFIEFFAADEGKATGPSRNILYLNECNNIPYSVVKELEGRSDEVLFYDFNPTADFWISTEIFTLPKEKYTVIKSNYKDNSELKPGIIDEIETKASKDKNYKRVHIDVEFGNSEGLIFPNFNLVDAMPETDKQRYGMDFGFTNDPTTLVDVRLNNGQLYIDELLYQSGMTNGDIIRFLKSLSLGRKEIIADSAEPKSIEEIYRAGINIKPSVKGPDSIRRGIDLIKTYPLNVTKRSVNMIKEGRNYKWAQDKNGTLLNVPVDMFNHCWDPTRYACESLLGKTEYRPPKILSRIAKREFNILLTTVTISRGGCNGNTKAS